jgi:hypothetical protein
MGKEKFHITNEKIHPRSIYDADEDAVCLFTLDWLVPGKVLDATSMSNCRLGLFLPPRD